MAVNTFDIILFGLEIVGLTVYIIFMYTLYKYRDRAPFSSPFFKLMFVIGLIDIFRQIETVLLEKFPRLALLGMNKVVNTLPYFFAKVHVISDFYFGHAQVIGVLLVALNRLSVCTYLKNWTRWQLRMTFIFLWGLPLLFNIPLWKNEFYFSDNDTADGEAYLYWKNGQLRKHYLVLCALLCSSVAVASGLCYTVVVTKARQVRKEVSTTKIQMQNKEETDSEEKKLIFIGVVLTAHVGFCGLACIMWAFADDIETMTKFAPVVVLNGDLLNWVNPYVLLVCSKAVRKHFKAVLLHRPVNDVSPSKA